MYTDKEIEDLLFSAEEDQVLFSYRIEGYSIYAILRFTIETYVRSLRLMNSAAIAGHAQEEQKFVKPSLTIRVISKLKSYMHSKTNKDSVPDVFENISKMKTATVLFVCTSDLVNQEGYSVELFEELKYYKQKGNVVNFVSPIYSSIQKKHPLYDYYGAIVKDERSILAAADREKLMAFLKYLSVKLNIDFTGQINQWSYTASFFLNYAEQLSSYIKKSKCIYVMCRSAYTEPWVAMACHKTGAKLIEVQHGVVKPDHIYFNSVKKQNAAKLLLPDYILTLGEEWKEILVRQQFIYNNSNVFVIGTKDFNIKDYKATSAHSGPLKVVIAMPPAKYPLLDISDHLTDFFAKFSKKLADTKIILRPHPIDGVKSLDKYREYVSENIVISNPANQNFKELMLSCDVLISVISMCLYEALSYGKKVVSFEKFRQLNIESGILHVRNSEELYDSITKAGDTNSQSVKYLSPLNLPVLDRFYN